MAFQPQVNSWCPHMTLYTAWSDPIEASWCSHMVWSTKDVICHVTFLHPAVSSSAFSLPKAYYMPMSFIQNHLRENIFWRDNYMYVMYCFPYLDYTPRLCMYIAHCALHTLQIAHCRGEFWILPHSHTSSGFSSRGCWNISPRHSWSSAISLVCGKPMQ